MQNDAGTHSFSAAGAGRRIMALLEEPHLAASERVGRVLIAQGTVEGIRVRLVANDPSSAGGAIGADEAQAIAAALRGAAAARVPVIWLLDSSGADVRQGLQALGAFRRLFRAVLDVSQEGLPMLALLGRSCFGGASMLACMCDTRSYLPQTRLATSGPSIIEGASGKAAFDAGDQRAVERLLGPGGRLALHPEDSLREDSLPAARAAAVMWLRGVSELPNETMPDRHRRLRDRLTRAGITLDACASSADPVADAVTRNLSALLPSGYAPVVDGRLFRAFPPEGSSRALFLGVLGGEPVGARECWVVADWLSSIACVHSGSPVVLMLDANGHAASVQDEALLLADYLVHLAEVIAHLSSRGHRAVLWITGSASGASYVAFAAGVERVSALPDAKLMVLPARAVQRIVGSPAQVQTPDWFDSGVADALLDERLGGLHAPSDPRR